MRTILANRAALLAIASLAAGCGAIQNGPRQYVTISTTPPGAALTVDGRPHDGLAPASLDRNRDHIVRAELAGFEPAQRVLHSRPDPDVTLGNCLLFLCIPELWERGSPAHSRLVPEKMDIPLDPLGWTPR